MEVIYSGHASVQILLLWLIYFLFFFFMFLSIKSQKKKLWKIPTKAAWTVKNSDNPDCWFHIFYYYFIFLGGGVVVQSLKVRNITNSSQLSITHLVAVLTFAKIWAAVALICMCFCLMSEFFFPASKSSVWMSCFAVLLVSVLESAKQVHRKKYDIIKIYTWSKGSHTTWTLNFTVLNI